MSTKKERLEKKMLMIDRSINDIINLTRNMRGFSKKEADDIISHLRQSTNTLQKNLKYNTGETNKFKPARMVKEFKFEPLNDDSSYVHPVNETKPFTEVTWGTMKKEEKGFMGVVKRLFA